MPVERAEEDGAGELYETGAGLTTDGPPNSPRGSSLDGLAASGSSGAGATGSLGAGAAGAEEDPPAAGSGSGSGVGVGSGAGASGVGSLSSEAGSSSRTCAGGRSG